MPPNPSDRRTFLRRTGGCLAQLTLLDALGWMGPDLFAAQTPGLVVQEVPWALLAVAFYGM